jgi:hypothetical protein
VAANQVWNWVQRLFARTPDAAQIDSTESLTPDILVPFPNTVVKLRGIKYVA